MQVLSKKRLLTNILFIIIFLLTGARSNEFGLSSVPPTILTLQMIIDFAVEQQWKQLVFFDCTNDNDCSRTYAKPLVQCLSDKGIQTSIKSLTETTDFMKILSIEFIRLGVVIILDDIDIKSNNNLFQKLMPRNKTSRPIVLGHYVSWLVVSTKWNNTELFDAVKDWPLGVDSDFSIAMSFISADVIFQQWNQFTNKTCSHLRSYGRIYNYERLNASRIISPPETTFVQSTDTNAFKTISVFYIVSIYKIRMEANNSIELEEWETWTPSHHYIRKGRTVNPLRTNLKHNIMNFGLWNVSGYYDPEEVKKNTDGVDHASSLESLVELINVFVRCLNVSANITTFKTSQLSTTDDLLAAVKSEYLDLGAVYLDVDIERNDKLYFSYPISHYKRSIFFKPPQTSTNIFLQPFSKKMLLCVLATLVVIIGVMEIINYVTQHIHWKEDREHFGLGEATLWCISIMCMQGSPWTPRTRAGKTVLLGSLVFSLIIYNSYSGSITSILSVKTYAIKNISDFFDYDYIFACSIDDDTYMSTKPELRNYYLKTLENQQTKVPEQTGLEKSIDGNYAFFITETIAKRILRNALMFKRCQISELQTNTPGILALPMSILSPYKKVINISILRMWQHGILKKLNLQLKPPLLNCDGVLKYNQAQFMDVYGAFVILLVGAMVAVAIFFFERAWINKRRLKDIHLPVHLPEVHLPDFHFSETEKEDLKPVASIDQSFLQTTKLSIKLIDFERSFREKKERQLSMANQYGSQDSPKNRQIRQISNDPKLRARNNESQLIRYSEDGLQLFPYCP